MEVSLWIRVHIMTNIKTWYFSTFTNAVGINLVFMCNFVLVFLSASRLSKSFRFSIGSPVTSASIINWNHTSINKVGQTKWILRQCIASKGKRLKGIIYPCWPNTHYCYFYWHVLCKHMIDDKILVAFRVHGEEVIRNPKSP